MTKKIALDEIVNHFIVRISITSLILFVGFQITFAYECCMCENCKKERSEAEDLIARTKFDKYNKIASKIQTGKEFELIISVLDPDSVEIKKKRYENYRVDDNCHQRFRRERTSLDIIIALLRQSDLSGEMTSVRVIPSLRGFIQLFQPADTIQNHYRITLGQARRTLWCAEQHVLSVEDKNAALLEAVAGPDNFKSRVALDMLSDIDYKFESIIGDLWRIREEKEKQGLKEAASRIQYCIKIIGIRQSLRAMDNRQKFTFLNDLFKKYAFEKRGWGTNEFVLWVITRLKLIGDNASIESLGHIWNNESYHIAYRTAAQEALISLGTITPEERKIVFEK
jgi:hypothetical protein